MKRKQFTEEQIIAVLKEHETGMKPGDLAPKHSIVDIACYGTSVEMELLNGEHWAIECIGPDAFRVYPGILREDTVTWLNLWVVADYTLEKMIEEVNRVTQSPANEK